MKRLFLTICFLLALAGVSSAAQDFIQGAPLSTSRLRFSGKQSVTIASDVITVSKSHVVVSVESGASDNLLTINGGTTGDVLTLEAADPTKPIYLLRTGNIQGDADSALTYSTVTLLYNGTKWLLPKGRATGFSPTGTIAAAGDATAFPAATAGDVFDVTSAGWLGLTGAAPNGLYVNIGDQLYCRATVATGTYAQRQDSWVWIPSKISMPDGYRAVEVASNTITPTLTNGYYWLNGVMYKVENSIHSIVNGIKIASDADGMTAANMLAAGVNGTTFIATGAGTWTLPTGVAGMHGWLIDSGSAHDLILDVTAGDTMRLLGTEQVDGLGITNASGSSTGDFVYFVCVAANKWTVVQSGGTWASQ